ncbi:MAG: hypothetical protein ACFFDT_35370 [Candidatus Hodarchaeota archaeon]
MRNFLNISSEITNSGLIIYFQNKGYRLEYPADTWNFVSDMTQKALLDNLTMICTMHLPMVLSEVNGINYSTSRPLLEPYLFQNFIKDLPSCTEVDEIETHSAIQKFLNIEYLFSPNKISVPANIPVTDGYKAVIGMSFGKDSLLTYAVAQELELNPEIVYVVEQSLTYERKHKTNLALQFKKEFDKELHILDHDTGLLRDYTYLGVPKSEYGWGLQNTEYTLEFIPFAYSLQGKYLFFGNEQSTASYYMDSTGNWRIYPCYDQSHIWTTHLDQVSQQFTAGSVRTGSLIEPLMDMMIQRTLVHRYPSIAKYQMSCFTDTEAGRNYHWCHECSVCAKMYLLCAGSNIDPKKIGLKENMFRKEKRNLFTIFGKKSELTYLNTGLGRDEQLFAFYLAAKNNIQGDVLENFRQSPLYSEAKEREEELIKTFCSIYDSISLPNELKSEVIAIYQEELDSFEI